MFVIIFGILTVVFFIITVSSDSYENRERFGVASVLFLCCTLLSIFSLFAPNEYEDKRNFVSSTEMVAMTDDGSVFLLESDQTVSYVSINQMLKKEVISLSKEDCAIIEEEDCKMPRVEMYEREVKKEWYHLIVGKPKIEYVIYVPVGSVTD